MEGTFAKIIMKRYKEKELKKFVIADLSIPTNYLFSNRNANYSFVDNIVVATKFLNRNIAQTICNECMVNCNIELVVVPLLITYEIIED